VHLHFVLQNIWKDDGAVWLWRRGGAPVCSTKCHCSLTYKSDIEERGVTLMPMAGKLRFTSLLDATWVQLWETEVDSDGVMDWVEKGQLNIPIPSVHWLIVFAPTVLLFITKQAVLSVDIQTRLLNEFTSRQEKVRLLFLWWASTLQPPSNYHVYVYYYWSCILIMCTLSNPMCL
jgi:hypothetical protein